MMDPQISSSRVTNIHIRILHGVARDMPGRAIADEIGVNQRYIRNRIEELEEFGFVKKRDFDRF